MLIQAPIWIQDCDVTMCQICAAKFTVTFRRHHCRACGKVLIEILLYIKVIIYKFNNN